MSGTSNRSVEVAVTRTTTMTTTMTTTAAETRNPDESPAAVTAARSTGAAPENRADEAELERLGATVRVVLRGLNGCAHALACAILVAIMAEFLARTQGAWVAAASPQAATLMVLLGVDIILDILSVALLRGLWPGWAILLRLICGVGYLAIFMAYVGLGRVFPFGYTYWKVPEGYGGPIVYLFLWLVGVWNLLHTALHRHELGNGLRTSLFPLRLWPRPEPGEAQRANWALWRSPTIGLGWLRQRWKGRRRTAADASGQGIEGVMERGEMNDANGISLAERRSDKKTVSLATSSSGSRTEDADMVEGDISPHRTTELSI